MAGVGTPCSGFGRISLVKRGERRGRVRRSSAGTLGAVKFEKDFAADFRAWREAGVWLPPRKTGAAGVQDVPGRVPRRWRGMTVDD